MASLFFSFVLSATFVHMPPPTNTNAAVHFYPDWTPGFVVLETNDTVACTLRYNQMVPEGLLQVLDGETTLTLSVRDVKCFFFFDPKKNRYRKFFTLSIPIDGKIKRETFLEYIYGNDKVSILNHKTMGLSHSYMEFTPFKQPVPINNLYLLECATGKVMPVSEENARSLFSRKQAVNEFIQANDIRFRKLSDYVKVFEYESSL